MKFSIIAAVTVAYAKSQDRSLLPKNPARPADTNVKMFELKPSAIKDQEMVTYQDQMNDDFFGKRTSLKKLDLDLTFGEYNPKAWDGEPSETFLEIQKQLANATELEKEVMAASNQFSPDPLTWVGTFSRASLFSPGPGHLTPLEGGCSQEGADICLTWMAPQRQNPFVGAINQLHRICGDNGCFDTFDFEGFRINVRGRYIAPGSKQAFIRALTDIYLRITRRDARPHTGCQIFARPPILFCSWLVDYTASSRAAITLYDTRTNSFHSEMEVEFFPIQNTQTRNNPVCGLAGDVGETLLGVLNSYLGTAVGWARSLLCR